MKSETYIIMFGLYNKVPFYKRPKIINFSLSVAPLSYHNFLGRLIYLEEVL